MRKLSLVVLLASTLASFFASAADLVATEVWSRASIPGAPNGVAYGKFGNESTTAVTIVGVATDVARAAEIHEHVVVGEQLRMRRVPELTITANNSAEFKPGGLHFMLFGLKAPLQAQERFQLTLRFSDGAEQHIEVIVREN